jgi:hypothetical protein
MNSSNRWEDGSLSPSRFIADSVSNGLPEEDLMRENDLKDATLESLARVGRHIVFVFRASARMIPGT